MSELVAIENQIKSLKEQAEMADLILRLHNNSDFKKLIDDEYLIQEAARNARLAGDPSLPPEARADCVAMALASGHLARFLSARVQMGKQAREQLPSYEEAAEEMRAEEGVE